jgi:capsule polysaccharide export protein KpsE/RkpR
MQLSEELTEYKQLLAKINADIATVTNESEPNTDKLNGLNALKNEVQKSMDTVSGELDKMAE